ncbi:MAG TPA: hypothetical protein PLB45_01050 [Bacilli bacterium]|jgi:hypothetical protein|nr:hypothetical protein [Bacilli bacterium]
MEKKEKKRASNEFSDFIRYSLGSLFILGGLTQMPKGEGFLLILVGISLYPIIYSNFISKFVKDKKDLTKVAVILPIVFFIAAGVVTPSKNLQSDTSNDQQENTTTTQKKDEEKETIKSQIQNSISGDDETITLVSENDHDSYNVIINNDNVSSLYSCALSATTLFSTMTEIKKIKNIDIAKYTCFDNTTSIGYVEVSDMSNSYSTEKENELLNIYDASGNKVDKTIDTLEKEEEEAKTKEMKDYKNSCKKLNYKDVLRDSESYKGTRVYWFGEVAQVINDYSYLVRVNCTKNSFSDSGYVCDDSIYITYLDGMFDSKKKLLEDDMVKLWGTVDGDYSYTTVLGASKTIPSISVTFAELQN